ncbi:MAG: hypothetical protein IH600_07085, partial [Bacteroidetes bacterium]|nr:hypothetical protein [Bacteroidota bacterium]
ILPENALRPVPKQYVTGRRWLDGSLHLFWREHELSWTPAPVNKPKRTAFTLGQADTRDHPWHHRQIGKLKRIRVSNP